ncbi:hypothetical protein CYMTET_9089, partial [Cymbomonas tetramitiformis]
VALHCGDTARVTMQITSSFPNEVEVAELKMLLEVHPVGDDAFDTEVMSAEGLCMHSVSTIHPGEHAIDFTVALHLPGTYRVHGLQGRLYHLPVLALAADAPGPGALVPRTVLAVPKRAPRVRLSSRVASGNAALFGPAPQRVGLQVEPYAGASLEGAMLRLVPGEGLTLPSATKVLLEAGDKDSREPKCSELLELRDSCEAVDVTLPTGVVGACTVWLEVTALAGEVLPVAASCSACGCAPRDVEDDLVDAQPGDPPRNQQAQQRQLRVSLQLASDIGELREQRAVDVPFCAPFEVQAEAQPVACGPSGAEGLPDVLLQILLKSHIAHPLTLTSASIDLPEGQSVEMVGGAGIMPLQLAAEAEFGLIFRLPPGALEYEAAAHGAPACSSPAAAMQDLELSASPPERAPQAPSPPQPARSALSASLAGEELPSSRTAAPGLAPATPSASAENLPERPQQLLQESTASSSPPELRAIPPRAPRPPRCVTLQLAYSLHKGGEEGEDTDRSGSGPRESAPHTAPGTAHDQPATFTRKIHIHQHTPLLHVTCEAPPQKAAVGVPIRLSWRVELLKSHAGRAAAAPSSLDPPLNLIQAEELRYEVQSSAEQWMLVGRQAGLLHISKLRAIAVLIEVDVVPIAVGHVALPSLSFPDMDAWEVLCSPGLNRQLIQILPRQVVSKSLIPTVPRQSIATV